MINFLKLVKSWFENLKTVQKTKDDSKVLPSIHKVVTGVFPGSVLRLKPGFEGLS
ncbi:uncharacterized protein METZ01_LOCUS403689 [marine metagenome]|uniref:Uncharacterized protein n=1 Tax=marine metagenome TaxID=408172 RepID=A0A382VXS6_9ZZZZ